MSYTAERIARVADSLYFRYAAEFFGCIVEDEKLQILRNVDTLKGIPMSWIEAWEMDGRRCYWVQWIERENAKTYKELVTTYGEDRAVEELNDERRDRVARDELREEEPRRDLTDLGEKG